MGRLLNVVFSLELHKLPPTAADEATGSVLPLGGLKRRRLFTAELLRCQRR